MTKLTILIFFLLNSSLVLADDKYASMAINKSQNYSYGWAYDHDDVKSASEHAIAECEKKSGGTCSTVMNFLGEGCGAYYTLDESNGSAFGWGLHEELNVASARALKECNLRANGQACTNHVYACNSKSSASFKRLTSQGNKSCLVMFAFGLQHSDPNFSADAVDLTTPIYKINSEDCPVVHKYTFSDYTYFVGSNWNKKQLSGKIGTELDIDGRGYQMAKDVYEWGKNRTMPISNNGPRGRTHVKVLEDTPENREDMKLYIYDYMHNDEAKRKKVCLAYTGGLNIIETIGKEHCSTWVN